jgi:hypothetical protein
VQFNHAGFDNCASCHAGRAPANHYPGQCSNCHSTSTWGGATFSHRFPLDHGDANRNCQTCHPGNNTGTYTCYSCHERGRVADKHREEVEGDFSDCMRCHPTGKED